MSHSDQSITYHVQLSDTPADRVIVRVEDGCLVVRDINGARLLLLAPPSRTHIPVWQLDATLGISTGPGVELV